MYGKGATSALIASGFATTLVSLIMFAMDILAPVYIIIPVLLFAGGLIGKYLSG